MPTPKVAMLEKLQPLPAASSEEITAPDPQDARRVQLQRAAENYKAFFPVGDVRFTIYKEAGQYITRFTSLISGKVTQIPEPELLASMERSNGSMPTVFRTLV